MIRAMVLLAIIVALMASARSFLPPDEAPLGSPGVALAFGFVLLAALQTGKIFAALRMPRLTGYLLTGLVCGPAVSGLLTTRMVDSLGVVNGVAVGMIALSAGSELNFVRLRPRMRAILWIGAVAIPAALVLAAGTALLLADRLPFMAPMNVTQRVAAAVTLGVVFASLSPSVAIAILAETASDGPVSETVMGVVVLADIVIILLFALVHAGAASVFGVTGDEGGGISPAQAVLIEIFGSMIVGGFVALGLAVYIRRVKTKIALFVLAVCFMCAQVGTRLHLDVLLVTLTAGVLLENLLGVRGEVVHHELGPASLPIFAVFFAVAGAKLHLHDLQLIWPLALVFVGVRASSLFLGARLGTLLAGADPGVKKWAPFGLLPQAGVSVGLAVLIERHFPTWGSGARALILSVITLNELVGPVMLRSALVRAGEAGKRVGGAQAVDH